MVSFLGVRGAARYLVRFDASDGRHIQELIPASGTACGSVPSATSTTSASRSTGVSASAGAARGPGAPVS